MILSPKILFLQFSAELSSRQEAFVLRSTCFAYLHAIIGSGVFRNGTWEIARSSSSFDPTRIQYLAIFSYCIIGKLRAEDREEKKTLKSTSGNGLSFCPLLLLLLVKRH